MLLLGDRETPGGDHPSLEVENSPLCGAALHLIMNHDPDDPNDDGWIPAKEKFYFAFPPSHSELLPVRESKRGRIAYETQLNENVEESRATPGPQQSEDSVMRSSERHDASI
jgi:hypothetical protein